MANFKYKFESVKKVKEALEKKAKKEVAVIELEIEKLNDKKKEIYNDIETSRGNNKDNKIRVAEIQARKSYEYALEKQIELIDNNIFKLDKEKKIKLSDLIKKSQEHKMFETLEEIHRESFAMEQNKAELNKYDEIATQKFVRQQK